ncbi:MAG: (Fe-S)-binding protein [Bacteroidota bacterium]|nr:(Fe-S)-binding protein [Bacteroidota bacterium]
MIQIIIFTIISISIIYLAGIKYYAIYRNIQLGKKEILEGSAWDRWKNMLFFALGQRKMFTRPVSGIFHFFIYTAFIITQIEFVEIFIDGLSGTHRFFVNKLGGFYPFVINTIEILSLFAFVATIIFLYRRNILKLIRFQNPELKGWPSTDANLILFGEILLILGIFTMNAADQSLQKIDPQHFNTTGTFILSNIFSETVLYALPYDVLILLERTGWWLHYLVVMGFILYLPNSKHLHIFLAFPNSYYAKLTPRGMMSNMPVIENEVRSMLGLKTSDIVANENENFGVKDVMDLGWRSLLEAYSCTECGRCTSVCPANLTGKKLSPRKIIMDIRDRLEVVGAHITKNEYIQNGDLKSFDDGKSLFDVISKEEIYACTSCNACVEACPVLINPMDPILQMRRYDVLTNSGGPSEWVPMFNSLENNQAVWALSQSRTDWAKN